MNEPSAKIRESLQAGYRYALSLTHHRYEFPISNLMHSLHRFSLLILTFLLLTSPPASAALESGAVKDAHVNARLVAPSEGIRAGEPFTILLRLEMDEAWHTYTDPPGDAGMATQVEWTLPPGFSAGSI